MDAGNLEGYQFVPSKRQILCMNSQKTMVSDSQAAELTGVTGKTKQGEGRSSPTCLAPPLPDFYFFSIRIAKTPCKKLVQNQGH